MKIGVLSDTHGWLDPQLADFFKECDEVWHCGDIGDVALADELTQHHTFRAVYGNIDGAPLRGMYPKVDVFVCGEVKVVMTHIGGYPGHYDAAIYPVLLKERPRLFLCGHSHIAKVAYDKPLNCLHINPGAAGRYGFHKVSTAVRFVIEKEEIKALELIELNQK